jgi:hypothetical protein
VTAAGGVKPEINTDPKSGYKTPNRISINVVLPAPDGPTNATEVPAGIVKVALETAGAFLVG